MVDDDTDENGGDHDDDDHGDDDHDDRVEKDDLGCRLSLAVRIWETRV